MLDADVMLGILLSGYIHMMKNRLGVGVTDEAYLRNRCAGELSRPSRWRRRSAVTMAELGRARVSSPRGRRCAVTSLSGPASARVPGWCTTSRTLGPAGTSRRALGAYLVGRLYGETWTVVAGSPAYPSRLDEAAWGYFLGMLAARRLLVGTDDDAELARTAATPSGAPVGAHAAAGPRLWWNPTAP